METKAQNLFLLYDNLLSSNRIVDFLKKKFSNSLLISTFDNGNELLKSVDADTEIVLLDYDLESEKADLILQQIKKRNQNTKVIILSSDDDIATAIDAYRKGAKSFIPKNKNTFTRIQSVISSIVYYPAAIIQSYFGLKELLAIFIVEIIYIGIVVFIGFLILK